MKPSTKPKLTELQVALFNRRMKQVELADLTGIPYSTLNQVINKRYLPPVERQEAIAAALKTTRKKLWPELFKKRPKATSKKESRPEA